MHQAVLACTSQPKPMAQGHQILFPPLARVGRGWEEGDGETNNIIERMLDFHLTDSQKCYSRTPRRQIHVPSEPNTVIE